MNRVDFGQLGGADALTSSQPPSALTTYVGKGINESSWNAKAYFLHAVFDCTSHSNEVGNNAFWTQPRILKLTYGACKRLFMRNYQTGQTEFHNFRTKKTYPVCNELGPTVVFSHFGHKAVVWKPHLMQQGQPYAYVYDLDRNTTRRMLLPAYTVDIMSEPSVHKQASSIYVVTTNKSCQRYVLTSVKIS